MSFQPITMSCKGFYVGEDNNFCRVKSICDIQPVIDRVGGGDAFTAGILNGVLKGWESQK